MSLQNRKENSVAGLEEQRGEGGELESNGKTQTRECEALVRLPGCLHYSVRAKGSYALHTQKRGDTRDHGAGASTKVPADATGSGDPQGSATLLRRPQPGMVSWDTWPLGLVMSSKTKKTKWTEEGASRDLLFFQ